MIRESTLARQVVRLSIMPCKDSGNTHAEVWAGEIAKAMRQECEDDQHVIGVVDHILRTARFRPTPAEVYEAIAVVPRVRVAERPNKSCPACNGTGWERVWQLVTWEGTPGGGAYKRKETIEDEQIARQLNRQVSGIDQIVYDCVRRCTKCNYGRALSAAEEHREVSA